MSYSPSIQAKMELEKRFRQAKEDRMVNKDEEFRTVAKNKGGGTVEMWCIDKGRSKIKATGSVTFIPNITDQC